MLLQNNGSCSPSYYRNDNRSTVLMGVLAEDYPRGYYCDVGQEPWAHCGYCNLRYKGLGGPPTNCTAEVCRSRFRGRVETCKDGGFPSFTIYLLMTCAIRLCQTCQDVNFGILS